MSSKTKGSGDGYYLGSVEFSGIGGYREKMISELLENGIHIRKIVFSEIGISGEVSPFDYFKTAKIAAKNGVKIRAGKRRGLYFTISKYRYRAGLYAGLLIFALMISLWRTRVQDISISGDVPKQQVMNILDECGIKLGAPTSTLKMSMAEHKLMLEVAGCAWADVSCEGFRVNVRVEKGTDMPEIEDEQPRNVVALRPARIVRQVVRKGASVVNNGSGVNTGDMLVSGIVPDEGEHFLTVRADAEIIGEWEETTEFFVPFRETVSTADGERKTFKYLVFGDDVYPLFWGRAFADDSVYSEETSIVKLFGENTPLKIKTGIYTAYTRKTITRSPEAAASELRKQKDNYEHNFYSDCEIIHCEEKFFPEENGIRLILEYTLQGDIARPVYIEFDNSPSENSEESHSES